MQMHKALLLLVSAVATVTDALPSTLVGSVDVASTPVASSHVAYPPPIRVSYRVGNETRQSLRPLNGSSEHGSHNNALNRREDSFPPAYGRPTPDLFSVMVPNLFSQRHGGPVVIVEVYGQQAVTMALDCLAVANADRWDPHIWTDLYLPGLTERVSFHVGRWGCWHQKDAMQDFWIEYRGTVYDLPSHEYCDQFVPYHPDKEIKHKVEGGRCMLPVAAPRGPEGNKGN